MKKSFFPILILSCLFLFFFSSFVYAQYSGYFLKGFAEGLQSGINTALKMKVLKLQKEELELQKKQLELLEELIYLQNESNKIKVISGFELRQVKTKLEHPG